MYFLCIFIIVKDTHTLPVGHTAIFFYYPAFLAPECAMEVTGGERHQWPYSLLDHTC